MAPWLLSARRLTLESPARIIGKPLFEGIILSSSPIRSSQQSRLRKYENADDETVGNGTADAETDRLSCRTANLRETKPDRESQEGCNTLSTTIGSAGGDARWIVRKIML